MIEPLDKLDYLSRQTDFAEALFKGVSGYAVIAANFDGEIIAYNMGAEQIYGYPAADILSRPANIEMLFPREFISAGGLHDLINRVMSAGECLYEGEKVRRNGERFPARITLSLVNTNDRKMIGFVEIVEDLTERRRWETAITKMNEELEQRVKERTAQLNKANTQLKQEIDVTAHLLRLAEALAHFTNDDSILEQAVACGHKVLKCGACLSYMLDEGAGRFRPAKQAGLPRHLSPVFMTESLAGDIASLKEVVTKGAQEIALFDSKTAQALPFSYIPDIKTLAMIPLTIRKKLLGVLIVTYSNEAGVTEWEKKIMLGISHQVSTALEQARLYREAVGAAMDLSRKIETIQIMHEIDRNILSTLGSQEVLEVVTRLISRVISCERAIIATVDKKRNGFIYTAGYGVPFLSKGAFVPFEDTLATEVVSAGRPQYIPDLQEIESPPFLEAELVKAGFLSSLRVPLVVKQQIAGILNIGSKTASAYMPEDLAILEKIASQLSVAMEKAGLIEDLKELFIGIVRSLVSAIDAKSPWTSGHSARVTEIATAIGREMGMNNESLARLEIAGLLHDVGKIGTYEKILDKTGRLDAEEQGLMRQHPSKGADILLHMRQFEDIIPAVKHHHEHFDGSGYPSGLKGEGIPIMARILAVADTVDAMGANRPYRRGMPMDTIVMELRRCSGTQFEPSVVDAFLKTGKAIAA